MKRPMSTSVWLLLCLAYPVSLRGEPHVDGRVRRDMDRRGQTLRGEREVPGPYHVGERVRRGVDRRGLTLEEKQKILDLHNKYRREEAASDMTIMQWDSGLERMAQHWADQCVLTHSKKWDNEDFLFIGENRYVKTDLPSALDIVKDWIGERLYYNYYIQHCTRVCGNYTQIVWAESEYLGCGIRFCSRIQSLDRHGYVVVCKYGPGGNLIGQRPYTGDGPACSACPRTHKFCIQGLCSRSAPPTTTSTTPSTTVKPTPTTTEQHSKATTTKPNKTTVSVGSAASILPWSVGYLLTLFVSFIILSLFLNDKL